jgi:probable phosphoglycerate mutase
VLGGDRIAGRLPVELSDLGRHQVARLVEHVANLPIRAVYSSPVRRAHDTALPVAQRLGLSIEISDALAEIDYGDWTGKSLDELRPLEAWKQWNAFRSGAAVPGGETMLQIQARVIAEMNRLRHKHPDQLVALFSHGDVIRAALAYWLGSPLDLFHRIEISLASVSVVAIGDYGPWVLCVNNTQEIVLDAP